MTMSLKVDTKAMTARLTELGQNAVKRSGAALYTEAQLIMTAAKRDVPVDTGALRSSGHVDQPAVTGDAVNVQLGFGGTGAQYALYVHENLSAKHKSGKAKFLESNLQAAAGELTAKVAARIGSEL